MFQQRIGRGVACAVVASVAGGTSPVGTAVALGAEASAGVDGARKAQGLIDAFGGMVSRDRVRVRFENHLAARVAEGVLRIDSFEPAVFVGLEVRPAVQLPKFVEAGVWQRGHEAADDRLLAMRQKAQARLGRELPDLRNDHVLILPEGVTLERAIEELGAVEGVASVRPIPLPAPAPLPPDFTGSQGYHATPVDGTNAWDVWTWPGGSGGAIRVCDVEYSFNASHEDLPVVTIAGPVGVDPFANNSHGTAVMGMLFAMDNGWGTLGGVVDASAYFAYANLSSGYNVAGAITSAATMMDPGDVIIIEQQTWGPNSPPAFVDGFVPSEWDEPVYNAIVQAVASGVIVVAAAGNGGEDLDDPIFSVGNGGHYPFVGGNDSGAIIVGAGAAPASYFGSDIARSRLWFSTYGSRVNLQGWGERVASTGYGGLFSAEGVNRWYTSSFGGTSSATPIVTSAVGAVSSVIETVTGSAPDPSAVRGMLEATGTPQEDGFYPSTQKIGPLPNARAAIESLLGGNDCNQNSQPDAIDIFVGQSLDLNADTIPDECQCDSLDFNGDGIFPDNQDLTDFINVFAGAPCPTGACGDLDFNNDGIFPDNADIAKFVEVLAGGSC
jgi:hypothetical protein